MKEIEKGFQVADAVSICVLPAIRLARINAICSFPIVVHPVSIGIRIGRLRILLNIDGPCLLFYMAVSRLHLRHDPSVKRIARERSAEQPSELQSLMRITYAVLCLKKKNQINTYNIIRYHYTTNII